MRTVIKQILPTSMLWVATIVNLAQLHEDVDDAEEVAGSQGGGGVGGGHVVLIQGALALGQAAAHDVLVLARQLLLHLALQPPQQERPQHAMQPLHQRLITPCAD